MRSKNFKGKRGTSSKLIGAYAATNLKREKSKKNTIKEKTAKSEQLYEEKNLLKKPVGLGRLVSPDIRDISIGFNALGGLLEEGLDVFSTNVLQGENKKLGKLKEGLILYTEAIKLSIKRGDRFLQEQSNLKEYVEDLRSSYRVAQAARDGVFIKQDTRKEKDENGNEREVKYDVSMTEREVVDALKRYRDELEIYRYNQLSNYVSIGVNTVGIMGMITQSLKQNKESKQSFSIISAGITAVSLIKLLIRDASESTLVNDRRIRDVRNRKSREFLSEEQISFYAEQDTIEDLKKLANDEKNYQNKGNNIQFSMDISSSVIASIITGMYVSNQLKAKGKTSLDSKTLAESLISLGTTKGYVGSILRTIIHMKDDLEMADELKFLTSQVEEIEKQMKEKVYPLVGATKSFDSFSIENLDGKFYPTTDYDTGEISYATKIKVPEFSVRRGQTVLLTGDSGAGKSTFLRLLKRGDINNRRCIKLDNGEVVDNLGKEYIAFKPSTELGNEGTVLSQITGKESISDLEQAQRESLTKILRELNLYSDRILEDMASKRFSQFSTGQQRRLVLSKMLYRIKDGTSVVIVDEPVGNVQDDLIKEQLEIIKRYAMSNNMMLILVTHRIDLAEKIVDKRYHISEDGVMREIEVKKQEEPRELT